jgi:hypothetical protein
MSNCLESIVKSLYKVDLKLIKCGIIDYLMDDRKRQLEL